LDHDAEINFLQFKKPAAFKLKNKLPTVKCEKRPFHAITFEPLVVLAGQYLYRDCCRRRFLITFWACVNKSLCLAETSTSFQIFQRLLQLNVVITIFGALKVKSKFIHNANLLIFVHHTKRQVEYTCSLTVYRKIGAELRTKV
jgi:hypothetical protein